MNNKDELIEASKLIEGILNALGRIASRMPIELRFWYGFDEGSLIMNIDNGSGLSIQKSRSMHELCMVRGPELLLGLLVDGMISEIQGVR